ncbi:MAG: DNA repair protein RecO [Hyphomonadaceae bacterium]|nr:DNA repair protein RecO [Hyphomonadaceae bacterium]
MDWTEEGYILAVKPHGETSAIINILTKTRGRHAGLVRGGRSRRLRPVLQPGNKVTARWQARLSEHLGSFNVEALDAQAAIFMEHRTSLAGLNSISALCMAALPERESHENLYTVFEILLDNLHDLDIWPALYIRFELALLQALGYGLDLSKCAATGSIENLTHISPRSGRAVSAGAAEPYLDKMIPLPGFLNGTNRLQPGDIVKGLDLTGYFLETRVFHAMNKETPPERNRLVDLLTAAQESSE